MSLLAWISANFRTFLWAFALSVAVWVAAVTSADPDEARPLPNPVPIEIVGQDPSLVVNTELPAAVELVLRAPRSVWTELDADPQSVRAILDLSGRAAGKHRLSLQIQVAARPARIVSSSPATVEFTLEPLVTETMDVNLSVSGEPAIGYQAGDPVFEPQEVILAGAKSSVDRVRRLRVGLNLTGLRESAEEVLPVQALDENDQPVTALTITPASVRVTLPISQQGGYRDMAVKVVTRGIPASGYRLTDISVFPPVITIYAAQPELVNLLPAFLETQPLDLSNAADEISIRLGLNLPPGVSVVGEQTVLIEAGVSAIESSITLADEKVTVVGLSSSLRAQISPSSVDVIVSGPLTLLYTLTPQDVRASVDVTGLGPGTYQRTAVVEILIADVVVESVLPASIQIVLAAPGSPTPTPRP